MTVSKDDAVVIGVSAAILGVAAVILWCVYGLRHVFQYSIEKSAVDIRVLGFTCRRLPFSDIERVEVIPFASLIPFNRSFRADLLFAQKLSGFSKRLVAIKKRTGVRHIIISPEDPDGFSSQLKNASAKAGASDQSAGRTAGS